MKKMLYICMNENLDVRKKDILDQIYIIGIKAPALHMIYHGSIPGAAPNPLRNTRSDPKE